MSQTKETPLAVGAAKGAEGTTLNLQDSAAPQELQAVHYSRGATRYDNAPEQCEAADFDTFAAKVLADRSDTKGKAYVCCAFADGHHNDPEKYPGVKPWRCKRLAQPRAFAPFDVDGATPTADELLRAYLTRFHGFGYRTASHTEGSPRLRFVLAQTRETDRDEGIALCEAMQALIEQEIGVGLKFDRSVYKGEQPLYTPLVGAEVFSFDGEPIDVDAMLVGVVIPDRRERVQADDPLLRMLDGLGMIKADCGGGKYHIECPWEAEHSMDGGSGETAYFIPHTGGYARGHFHCLHAGCKERTDNEFATTITSRYTQQYGKLSGLPVLPEVPKAQHLTTDMANAERLQRAIGTDIMFAAGRWYSWKGTHWSADESAVYRQACHLSVLIRQEADEWSGRPAGSAEEREKNNDIAEGLRKWAKVSEMKRTLDAAFALLRRLVEVPVAELDADPFALNVANGTIDLRTGKLRPHDKADRITRLIAINYTPEARAPLFEKSLAEIMDEAGQGVKPVTEFMQRWFGYCATGLVSEQVFAIHHGDGENGKSKLLGTIEWVLGPYAGPAAPHLMVGKAYERHPTEVADLRGRRMVTAFESSEDGILNEEFIKGATGGDKMKARYMRQDFFEFYPSHKLQLVTNHKPQIRGQDRAIWRRVVLIPYGVIFGTAQEVADGKAHRVKDEGIGERVKEEAEGILTWIVRGAVKWRMVGLNAPDTVRAAGEAYREEQDRVGQFITEHCQRAPEAWTPLSGLYRAYQEWARTCGYAPLGRNKFSAAVERRPGVHRVERRQGFGFEGLRLTTTGWVPGGR